MPADERTSRGAPRRSSASPIVRTATDTDARVWFATCSVVALPATSVARAGQTTSPPRRGAPAEAGATVARASEHEEQDAHGQRGITVYVTVAVYCPAGTLGSGAVKPIFVAQMSPAVGAAADVEPIVRSAAGAIGSAARTVGEMPAPSVPARQALSPTGRAAGRAARTRCDAR